MINRILLRFPDIEQHYLLISQGTICTAPTAVHTVLGSCVSVVFFCQRHKAGGIFHALLPKAADYKDTNTQTPYRYVDTAVQTMWRTMCAMGVDRNAVQCKIFGGANALMEGEYSAGPKNALSAFESLSQIGLRVVASHVGGPHGRKLLFLSHTGEVYVKTLNMQPPEVGL